MVQTKITVKVYEPLLKKFNVKLESCFLKRDAFLHHMIQTEIPHLKRDMKGLKLSSAARLHISRALKRLGTKTINVVVDKSTADKLNAIVRNTNLVRDAFINRLILFLISSDALLKYFDIPGKIDNWEFSSAESMSPSPLMAIESIIYDPLYYLRTTIERPAEKSSIYLLDLPQRLEGMACFLDDSEVPGTSEYKTAQSELIEIETLMDL